MTATEQFHKLLDERKADYRISATGYSIDIGPYITAYANRSDTTLDVSLRQVTPEQAIVATLGPGMCKVETTENWLPAERYHRCKHCGAFFAVLDASGDIPPRVCPNCGRRVIDK